MPEKLPYGQRARSVPHKGAFLVAVWWMCLFWIGLLATLTALIVLLVQEPTKFKAIVFIVCMGSTALVWLIGFFKRLNARCPLCKGTPYLQTGAHVHEKATRIFPFNYSTSNLIRTVFAQRMRCHYCGTPYDYLKPVKKRRSQEEAEKM